MGSCCGKPEIVVPENTEAVENLRRIRTPPPAPPHRLHEAPPSQEPESKYAGPPPEYYVAQLATIESSDETERTKMIALEQSERKQLRDRFHETLSAQKKVELTKKQGYLEDEETTKRLTIEYDYASYLSRITLEMGERNSRLSIYTANSNYLSQIFLEMTENFQRQNVLEVFSFYFNTMLLEMKEISSRFSIENTNSNNLSQIFLEITETTHRQNIMDVFSCDINRLILEMSEHTERKSLEEDCTSCLSHLKDSFFRTIREQELQEMLALEVGELEHNLVDEKEIEDLNSFPPVDLEEIFGRKKMMDEEELRYRDSRRTTKDSNWGVFEEPKSSSVLRSRILDKHPFIKLEIDEVGSRDEISREGLGGLLSMRLEAFQHAAIFTRRRIVYPYLLCHHLTFLGALCECEEGYHRVDFEFQWLRGVSELYLNIFKKQSKQIEWSQECKRMEERRAKRNALKKATREEERRSDRLRWEIERVRMESQKNLSAPEKLRAELGDARQLVEVSINSKSPGRITRENARKQATVSKEEERCRSAITGEETARWNALWDFCAKECPWIVLHPQRDVFIMKKDAEVAKWNLLAKGIVSRENIASFFSGVADNNSLQAVQRSQKKNIVASNSFPSQIFLGKVVALSFEQSSGRDAILKDQTTAWETLTEEAHESFAVRLVHSKRKAVRIWDSGRADRLEENRSHALFLIQRVSRGFLWRCRIAVILPVFFEVRTLVGNHSREHRTIVQQEHIDRGDLFHYFVQETRLFALNVGGNHIKVSGDSLSSFVNDHLVRMFPKTDVRDFGWDPTVLLPVEQLAREKLWRSFIKSFDMVIALPAKLDTEAIRGLPQHLVGARLRAVTAIQRCFRGYKLRSYFNATQRDNMIVAKLRRVENRAAMRALKEEEKEARFAIEEEYSNFGFHKGISVRESYFNRWKIEQVAACKIQGLVRGFLVRRTMDPQVLVYLTSKFKMLKKRLEWRHHVNTI